jgi:hypothetical protein
LIEIAAIPWLARGTAHVLDQDDAGTDPLVGDALRAARSPANLGNLDWRRQAGPLSVAALIGLVIGFLVERSGLILLEFVSDTRVYPLFGLLQGVSRALAAPLLLTTIALCIRAKDLPPKKPNLY